MERSTATRIKEWDRQETGDGRAGLSKLGDVEFSGAVDAGGAWLFMLNGRIVGTSGGSVDGVDPADPLTAYTSPHPSLPLLFAMRERGGEPQGRYFTDDTALAEVHDTLSSGSFTGYIELSEKVHSGDYYVVYYGGLALFVAFVGTSERLVTGEDAFERANDEVGIYEINSVNLEVQDPPESAAGASDDPEPAGDAPTDPEAGSRDQGQDASQDRAGEREPSDEVATEDSGVDENAGEVGTKADGMDAEPESPGPDAPGGESPEGRTDAGTPDTEPDRGRPTRTDRDGASQGDSSRKQRSSAGAKPSSSGGDQKSQTRSVGGLLGPDRDGVPWDDGQTIPALDPERTAVPTSGADAGREMSRKSDSGSSDREPEPTSGTERTGPETGGDNQVDDVTADRVAELEAEVEELRDQVESLSAEWDKLAEERDRTTKQRGETESPGEIESTGEFLADQTGGEETLSRRKAFAEADVFVRYDSRSRPTLADAHGGDASLEAVSENRQLEIHTRFDANAVTVDGEPLESFLQDTLAYRFVAWFTGEFLFEIRDSGNETALRDLYDAIPKVDRAEFDETVDGRGDGGEEPGTVFDIVFRSKTGEPLFLVDVDEGRDPTHGRLMSELIDRSTHVVQAGHSVAGVFLITASFFEAEAHETVRDATKSGFLDRDSRASFVKISRNDGYHACLVEARDDGFHLSRPDL